MKRTDVTIRLFDSRMDTDKKLRAAGFKASSSFLMEDFYFTIDKSLLHEDYETLINNSFIVRTVQDCSKTATWIVHKHKSFDIQGNVLEEEKTKTLIEDKESLIKILAKAGTHPYATLRSSNFVYHKGNDSVVVQEVEELGSFLEVEEFEHMQSLTPEEKRTELIKIVKHFNLNGGSDYSVKKLDLYLQQKNNHENLDL